MKKLVSVLFALLPFAMLVAGGLVTNTNQSAMFTRFQCRDSSIDIDGAFYNPAGLVHMSEGFYLSLNNQTMGTLNLITAEASTLTDGIEDYKGKISVPLFPSVYGVLRTGKIAFSVGIIPISGNGKSIYNDGLPSYNIRESEILQVLQKRLEPVDVAVTNIEGSDPLYSNITGYSVDISLESRSLHMGYQANMAYQINEYLSIAAGARVVHARTKINGRISGLTINGTNRDGTFSVEPADYLRTVATDVDTIATALLNSTADLIEERAVLVGDVLRTGVGITPVISINYAPSLMTNWSFKYEFKTSLNQETHVIDGNNLGGKFKDGSIMVADIPAMLTIGVTRRTGPRFMYYAGVHYYFDKPIDFDGEETVSIDMIDNNSYEFAIGAEYQVNSKYRASCGWLINRPGVNAEYQSGQRFVLPSNTIGAGIGLRLTPLIDLNLGGSYTLYKKGSRDYVYSPEDGTLDPVNVKEYYDSRSWVLSVGLDFLFGENN